MAELAAQAFVSRLADWGVDTVFGLPGDGINGIMEGLRREQHRVSFVLVHHEEAAAFMATGYAKATSSLGGCSSTTRLSCRGWWTSRSAPHFAPGGRPPDGAQRRPGRRCRWDPFPSRWLREPPSRADYLAPPVWPVPRTCKPRRRCSTPAPRRRSWRASARCRHGTSLAGRRAGAPVIKTLPGKGAARRLAVHDRRDRAARHRAGRGPGRGHRHTADAGHQLPVHEAPAGAWPAKVVQIDVDAMRVGIGCPTDVPLIGDVSDDLGGVAADCGGTPNAAISSKYQEKMATGGKMAALEIDARTRSRRSIVVRDSTVSPT